MEPIYSGEVHLDFLEEEKAILCLPKWNSCAMVKIKQINFCLLNNLKPLEIYFGKAYLLTLI
jgi:hypothetical protein